MVHGAAEIVEEEEPFQATAEGDADDSPKPEPAKRKSLAKSSKVSGFDTSRVTPRNLFIVSPE